MASATLAPALIVLAACAAAPATEDAVAAPEPTWTFELEPFVWLPSTDGSGSTETTPSLDVDLVGTFDAGLPAAFRALSPDGRISVLADGLWVRLQDDEGALRTTTEATMVEAGCGLALDEGGRWHAIAGLRWVDVDYDVELGPAAGSADAAWVDPWVGLRGAVALGERWSVDLRGDVGGFGVGTRFSWQAAGYLRTRLGSSVSVDVGYRAIGLDFESSELDYDVVFHGPVAGVGFSF